MSESSAHEETSDRLARRAFFGFVLTFILSRVVVFLIMSQSIPNLFFFLHAGHHIGRIVGPTLHELELNSSP